MYETRIEIYNNERAMNKGISGPSRQKAGQAQGGISEGKERVNWCIMRPL